MRQRGLANPGNPTQATPQIAVERGAAGIGISCLRCVQFEQQDVLAIEPQWNRVEIRQRPHEQAGGDQHQQ